MNRPPIKKKCPECGGSGSAYPEESDETLFSQSCDYCINGEVYNYLTPEQYVQWMRTEGGQPEYEMLDSDPVWQRGYCEWYLMEKSQTPTGYKLIIVARPGQPKPDDSWRPE